VKFTFETRAPMLVSHSPSGSPQKLDAPMFALFDQRIDPAAVLSRITVKAGGQARALHLVDAAELKREPQLDALAEAARHAEQDGRWLAFRATEPFPTDSDVEVEIAAGTPSAEGPNPTKEPQRWSFRTYPPLKVERSECGWNGECRPGMAFQIVFNNALDAARFDDGQLAISPAIPGVKVVQGGNALSVIGVTAARTRYTVTVSSGVVDEFGQTLGKDAPLSFSVGDASPTFFGADGMVVADPAAAHPSLDFFTTNYDQLKVQLYAVTPADYDAFLLALRNQWNRDHPTPLPGRKVFDQRSRPAAARTS